MKTEELILYRDFQDRGLLNDMVWLMESDQEVLHETEKLRGLLYGCMRRLLEMAGKYGFYGNLWHCYLTDLLVNDENSYSRACEIRGPVEGSVNRAALHDIVLFKELYDYDYADLADRLGVRDFDLMLSYEGNPQESRIYNTRIRDRICGLAQRFRTADTPEEMKNMLTDFYREYGVGRFGLHKAFRIVGEERETVIEPILNIAHVKLSDLIGYDLQKQKLIENTEAFVSGRRANNCLLFGDAGTGKSSCIKAIANAAHHRDI